MDFQRTRRPDRIGTTTGRVSVSSHEMTDTMFRSGSFRDNRYLRQDAERRRVQQIPPLSAAERKEVEEAFDLFDADRTGTAHLILVCGSLSFTLQAWLGPKHACTPCIRVLDCFIVATDTETGHFCFL